MAAVVGAALLLSAVSFGAKATPPGAAGALHRDGRWIEDEHGRVVLLHGVNVVWKVEPYVPPQVPGGLDDSDAARLAGHGFNTVRLGVLFAGIMPSKGTVDHTYLDRVSETVAMLGRHGLHVLLDIHQDLMGAPWGNGFPDWAVHHNPGLEQAEPNLGFPLNAVRPSHNLAWDFFWSDQKLATGDPQGVVGYLVDAVGAVADRLGHDPAVMGIELINEPWPGTLFTTCAAYVVGCPLVDAYVQHTWQRITDRIRSTAPDLLVWWEPNGTWNETVPSMLGAPPLTPAITDSQIGFAFHDYCGFGELSTYLGTPKELQATCDTYHDLTWQHAADFQNRTGLPNLVTEFANSNDPVELNRTLRRADANLTGWQMWHYGSNTVRTDPGDPLSAVQRSQLVRTYPQATAGTPTALSFDATTGAMRFTYTPRDLGVPTEIAVSDVHYPTGYVATVTGGHVTSAPGAAIVTIDADPGATTVTVAIVRR